MQAAGSGGAIVNIGSMSAHQAIAATPATAYSMAKAGLHALTHNLAMELAADGIRVNAVAPAVVATPLYEGFVPADKLEETVKSFDGFHPLGRVGTSAGHRVFDRVPALTGGQLDHRSDPERRRRRHGRPQLTARGRARARSHPAGMSVECR